MAKLRKFRPVFLSSFALILGAPLLADPAEAAIRPPQNHPVPTLIADGVMAEAPKISGKDLGLFAALFLMARFYVRFQRREAHEPVHA